MKDEYAFWSIDKIEDTIVKHIGKLLYFGIELKDIKTKLNLQESLWNNLLSTMTSNLEAQISIWGINEF